MNRENAILNAMNVRVEDRTPDIETFMNDINADPPVKRRYGKIKKIDVYSWPLWVKIGIPAFLSLVIAFGTLILTGVIKFSKFTEEIVVPDNIVSVPDVEGMFKEEALSAIEEGRLLASTDGTIESDYIPAGKIVLQTPISGSYMDVNSTVTLMVSSGKGVQSPVDGKSVVPYVIWDTSENAISKLLQAGLAEPEITEAYDDNVAIGSVIAQSVEAGAEVEEGTVITLTISLGAKAFEMPDVVGSMQEEAEEELGSKGLVVTVEYKKTDEAKEGTVLEQNIEAGTSVKRGDKVTITVSSGRETVDVADVVGMLEKAATDKIEEQGFNVKVLENYDNKVEKGVVINQTPGAGSAQLPGSTIVIYISKGKQPFTVSYDANMGSVNANSKTVYLMDTYGELPVPSRNGYTFNGWYTAKTGGDKITKDTMVATSSNHTLYAQWTPNTYVLTYDANGGSVSASSKKVTYGNAYGELPTPTKTGAGFKGWYTAKTGGTKINSDMMYTIVGNQIIYAQWGNNSYKITFDANGGSVSTTGKEVAYGSTYGELPTPTRTGYDFMGWYTAKEGGDNITSASKVTVTAAQTLYARWSNSSSNVVLDVNGGKLSETGITVTYGKNYGTLPTPTRTGYTFKGWYTAKTGGTTVTATTKVTATGKHTLYAQWTANSYKVVYDANGGSCGVANGSVVYDQTYGTLPTPTRTGYTFKGWYTAKDGGTEVAASTRVTITSGQTLYARWTANQYKIKFDGNGGTVSLSEKYVTHNTAYGTLPTVSRVGYTFNGWYTAKTGGTRIAAETVFTSATDVTLYAQWTANYYSYNVKYVNTSGVVLSTTNVTYAFGTTNTISPIAITGYNAPAAQIVVWDSVSPKTITFTYSPKSYAYTVNYVSSNGTNLGSTTVTKAYGTTNTISPVAKAGYNTPAAQSVKWDSEKKTITFTYTPSAVGDQPQVSGQWANSPVMHYLGYAEFQNRTATSVQVRVHWRTKIRANGYNPYGQKLRVSYGSISNDYFHLNPKIVSWANSVPYERTQDSITGWINIPLNTTGATTIDLSVYLYQINYDDTIDFTSEGKATGANVVVKVLIPAF